jgi:hypothetical protein
MVPIRSRFRAGARCHLTYHHFQSIWLMRLSCSRARSRRDVALCLCLLLGFQILNRKLRHVFCALTAPHTESSHHRLQPQPDHTRAGVPVLCRQAEKLGHWRCFGQCCGGRSSPWLRRCPSPWLRRSPSPWLRRCPSPWLRRCPSPWLRRCPSPWLRCCSRLECCSQSLKTHAPLHRLSKTFVLPSVPCSSLTE